MLTVRPRPERTHKTAGCSARLPAQVQLSLGAEGAPSVWQTAGPCLLWEMWRTHSVDGTMCISRTHVIRVRRVPRGWGDVCVCMHQDARGVLPAVVPTALDHSVQRVQNDVPSSGLGHVSSGCRATCGRQVLPADTDAGSSDDDKDSALHLRDLCHVSCSLHHVRLVLHSARGV